MSTKEEIEESLREEQEYYNRRMGRDMSSWPIGISEEEAKELGFKIINPLYEPFDEE